MNTHLNVVPLPAGFLGDIPRTLRKLADEIEAGEYGEPHLLAWVMDRGGSNIEVGLCGQCQTPGAEAHLLFALAQRKMEEACL